MSVVSNTNCEILSKFNRQQVQVVEEFDMNTRRKIMKTLRQFVRENNNLEDNVILYNHGININHFCIGQTLYHSTSQKNRSARSEIDPPLRPPPDR